MIIILCKPRFLNLQYSILEIAYAVLLVSSTSYIEATTKSKWPLFHPDYHVISKFWLKLDRNCWTSSLLKMSISEILQSVLNDPKLNSNDLTRKVPYICTSYKTMGLKFHPFRSIFNRFQDVAYFTIFPLTPTLKFQSF